MDQYYKANAVLSVFSKKYMDSKRDLPIRPSEMGVLNILSGTPGPHTPVMLAKLLGVSKPMITAHINTLVEKGYVTKAQSCEDRRVYHILLTEKAKALVEEARVDMTRQLDRIRETMGQENYENFIRLAQQANEVWKEK